MKKLAILLLMVAGCNSYVDEDQVYVDESNRLRNIAFDTCVLHGHLTGTQFSNLRAYTRGLFDEGWFFTDVLDMVNSACEGLPQCVDCGVKISQSAHFDVWGYTPKSVEGSSQRASWAGPAEEYEGEIGRDPRPCPPVRN